MLHDDEIVFNYVYRIFLFDLSWFKMEEKKTGTLALSSYLYVHLYIN